MARLSFALPILDRCERPRTASVRVWRLQPGRLAQGPDEKCGITGRMPGGLLMSLSFQIEASRCGEVARDRDKEGDRARQDDNECSWKDEPPKGGVQSNR